MKYLLLLIFPILIVLLKWNRTRKTESGRPKIYPKFKGYHFKPIKHEQARRLIQIQKGTFTKVNGLKEG